ncbi:MAG: hypothetical protein JKY92_02865 [Magnetovibrio sp.]|nr:hypothetical protein [Magnetovibrio sp.]
MDNFDAVGVLFNDFSIFANLHFKREIETLSEVNFDGYEKHQDDHDKLLLKLEDLRKIALNIGHVELERERLYNELVSWVFEDVIKLDLVFKSFLMEHGYTYH